jgi:hypothetical protein
MSCDASLATHTTFEVVAERSTLARSIAIAGSQVVIAGCSRDASDASTRPFVMRRDMSGSPDTSYGGGDAIADILAPVDERFQCIARARVLADGSVVAAGWAAAAGKDPATGRVLVYKLRPDGTLDPAFGDGDGIVAYNVGSGAVYPQDMVVMGDGRLLIVGNVRRGVGARRRNTPFASLLESTGAPATGFGEGGSRSYTTLPGTSGLAQIAVHQDDRPHTFPVRVSGSFERDGLVRPIDVRLHGNGVLGVSPDIGLRTLDAAPPMVFGDVLLRAPILESRIGLFMAAEIIHEWDSDAWVTQIVPDRGSQFRGYADRFRVQPIDTQMGRTADWEYVTAIASSTNGQPVIVGAAQHGARTLGQMFDTTPSHPRSHGSASISSAAVRCTFDRYRRCVLRGGRSVTILATTDGWSRDALRQPRLHVFRVQGNRWNKIDERAMATTRVRQRSIHPFATRSRAQVRFTRPGVYRVYVQRNAYDNIGAVRVAPRDIVVR